MVMVGRDIGTVVFPDARYKIYLEASPEERARRRLKEMQLRGETHSFEEVLQSIIRRDGIDSTRQHAPLKPAVDAVIIDTDGKSIEEVLEETLAIVQP
jgi:cytidylate kinase